MKHNASNEHRQDGEEACPERSAAESNRPSQPEQPPAEEARDEASRPTKIWIDADACPVEVRDIVIRAAVRLKVPATFVANKPLYVPESSYLSMVQVSLGPDVVDAYIVDHATEFDLAVTQDIPLAALLVARKVSVISPRGDRYDASNISEALAQRNLMEQLRDQGAHLSGQRGFDEKLKRQFANQFDAELNKLLRNTK